MTCGEIVVTPADDPDPDPPDDPDPDPPDDPGFDEDLVTLTCSVPSNATVGEIVDAQIGIQNDNPMAASYNIGIALNGSVVTAVDGVVGGSGNTAETVQIELTQPGEIDVSLQSTISEA